MTSDDFDTVTALMAAEDRGENPFNLIHRTDEQIAADNARETLSQQVALTARTTVKVGSKRDQAIAIYLGLEDKSRKGVMTALQGAGFGVATSSTYASNLRNGAWVK